MGGRRVQLATHKSRSSANTNTPKIKSTDSTSVIKQAKKRHKSKKWSKDRADRVREALDHDADLMQQAMGKSATTPTAVIQTDAVLTLTENMQTLGK